MEENLGVACRTNQQRTACGPTLHLPCYEKRLSGLYPRNGNGQSLKMERTSAHKCCRRHSGHTHTSRTQLYDLQASCSLHASPTSLPTPHSSLDALVSKTQRRR